MATKIDSAPSITVRTTLRVRSQGAASVVIITDKVRKLQQDGKTWADDALNVKQIVRFSSEDGAVELSATVPDADALDAGTQFEAVLLVEISTQGLPAFEAGRKGRNVAAVSLLGVLEVLDATGKRVWASRTGAGWASGGKSMDEGGKIRG